METFAGGGGGGGGAVTDAGGKVFGAIGAFISKSSPSALLYTTASGPGFAIGLFGLCNESGSSKGG